MKATMMKVSDPIIFGHAVKVFFAPVFEKFGDNLAAAGVNVNNGFGNLLANLDKLDADTRAAVEAEIAAVYAANLIGYGRFRQRHHQPASPAMLSSMLPCLQ